MRVEAPSLIIDLNLKKKVVKVLHLVIGLYGATNRKVAGSIPASVTGFFIHIKAFRLHYGSGVDSASNRNEYQGYFMEIRAAGA